MCRIVILTHTLAAAVAVAGLSGCVGQAGIGADGAVTAERESNAVIYTRKSADGSEVSIQYLSAKKGELEGLRFSSNPNGQVSIDLDRVASGDRTADRSIAAVEDSLAIIAPLAARVSGTKITLNSQRKQAQELRREEQARLRRQQALLRTELAEKQRLEAERALLLEQERLRAEAAADGERE